MLFDRIIRAARLDISLYNEVEANESLTGEAATVVILASLASGVGALIAALIGGWGFGWAILYLILGVVFMLMGWAVIALVAQLVGTSLFKGKATYGELLRTLGYAQGPSIARVLNFIPVVGTIINVVAGIWTLVTSFIAVREALDIESTPAIITCLISWAVFFVLQWVPLWIMSAIVLRATIRAIY